MELKMIKYITVLLICTPLLMQAADIGELENKNIAIDRQACIDDALNKCINLTCINSSSLNCTENCQKVAENKCQELSQ